MEDHLVESVAELRAALDGVDYLADLGLATALFCAVRLRQPVLLEGEAGVGKTESAKALAEALDTPLVRLQCYEGITAAEALYEWNYPRQLLAIRRPKSGGAHVREDDLFSAAVPHRPPAAAGHPPPGPRPAVLLIDEIDRADDEFEAFLFELLAESAVTIPELAPSGRASADRRPDVEPHPRPARRPEAPLPVPLDRRPWMVPCDASARRIAGTPRTRPHPSGFAPSCTSAIADWLQARGDAMADEWDEILGYHLEQAYRYRAELGPVDDHGAALAVRAAERLGAAGRRAFERRDGIAHRQAPVAGGRAPATRRPEAAAMAPVDGRDPPRHRRRRRAARCSARSPKVPIAWATSSSRPGPASSRPSCAS